MPRMEQANYPTNLSDGYRCNDFPEIPNQTSTLSMNLV
jgi:hypothetical protein